MYVSQESQATSEGRERAKAETRPENWRCKLDAEACSLARCITSLQFNLFRCIRG